MAEGPPAALVRALVDGPSVLSGLEWHSEIDSTNRRGVEAAAAGVDEVYAVLADRQTAGRGRLGRRWEAPAGTSLLLSLVCRPASASDRLPLLGLLTGVALADAAAAHCPGSDVALKWPNDLLVEGRKAAGILVEHAAGAVVIGAGVNVDWRGVERPPDLAHASSIAEAAGRPVDRWRILAGLIGVFGNRYQEWCADPAGFLDDYRDRCATLGRQARVESLAAPPIQGLATAVSEDGALEITSDDGQRHRVAAGDVVHLHPR
jgi:BirA family transcriptional regulator, biotin operon repressor / biotin---[acetyl-CoA-carboxylase] ligase